MEPSSEGYSIVYWRSSVRLYVLEKLVGVGSVCEVSKPVVNKVFVVFRRRGEGGDSQVFDAGNSYFVLGPR